MKSRRGSVILISVIFTGMLAIIAGSLLGYTMSERRLNQRSALRYEAKNAAEAILEYGASELSVRFRSDLNFSTAALSTTPLSVFDARFGTLFANGSSHRWTNVDPGSIRLWVSQTSEAGRRYIDPTNPANDFDPLRGQRVSVRAVRMLATATATTTTGLSAAAQATQLFEVREAALFNYAIFYNLPMEFHPSPNMTIVGPVHSNFDTNLTEANGLRFLGMFSTAGKFTAGATTAGRPGGRNIAFTTGIDDNGDGVVDTVSIVNPSVNGQTLSTYVDSDLNLRAASRNFGDTASQIWRGYVQDESHGVMPHNPPGVLTGPDAHKLIEPPDATGTATIESQKFSRRAGLYMVVESDGTVTALTSADHATEYKAQPAGSRAAWRSNASNLTKIITPPSGMINNTRRMYDHRESRWINMVDINVGVMRTAVNTTTADAASNFKVNGADWSLDDSSGWNGIVYVDVESPLTGYTSVSDVGSMGSGSGTRTAVRLVNGAQIPNRASVNTARPEGFTLATNAPAYLVGHYNSNGSLAADLSDMTTPEANEAPAAIIADSVNILSQAWWDTATQKPARDSTSNETSRPTSAATEISCAFLTGIVSTNGSASSNYSGGVENYPRFHENWTNISLRYRGSIVALFESTIARGTWSSARYSPPRREWGFNSMFAEGRYPPGTPRLRTFRRLDYRDLSNAESAALLSDTRLAFSEM